MTPPAYICAVHRTATCDLCDDPKWIRGNTPMDQPVGTVRIVAVGLSSLFPDARMGTDAEQHVLFADIDGDDPDRDPDGWRSALHVVARRYKLGSLYVRRTLKGRHLFSPTLATRRQHERAEEALEAWGADGMHRFVAYQRGQSILRVTPKPGEPPAVVEAQLHADPDTEAGRRDASRPHWIFLTQLWQGMELHRGNPLGESGTQLRLARYKTRAVVGRAGNPDWSDTPPPRTRIVAQATRSHA